MPELRGQTLLLTRADEDGADWEERIRDQGGRVVRMACIECEILREPTVVQLLSDGLQSANWLALTSSRGAEAVAILHTDPLPADLRIAAVGRSTAEAIQEHLRRTPDTVTTGTGADLAHALAEQLEATGDTSSAHVLAAGSDRFHSHLDAVLATAGVRVSRIPVYRTVPAAPTTLRVDLDRHQLDGILLASPSAVEGLLNRARIPQDLPVYTIGPTTSAAARSLGLRVTAEATRPDIEGLLEVIS